MVSLHFHINILSITDHTPQDNEEDVSSSFLLVPLGSFSATPPSLPSHYGAGPLTAASAVVARRFSEQRQWPQQIQLTSNGSALGSRCLVVADDIGVENQINHEARALSLSLFPLAVSTGSFLSPRLPLNLSLSLLFFHPPSFT